MPFFKVNGILYTDQWSEKEVRMSRNKYPEETEKKILDAAYELFVERGYENTSIQNIIDRTALSKGAIYHHFESKESILLAVFRRVAESIAMESRKVVETKDMTGRQKIQKILLNVFDDKKQMQLVHAMPNLLESPHILALYLKITMEEITPRYLYPVIQEGIRDGSIVCEHPMEVAELLAVLANVWMNPLIYPFEKKDVAARFETLNQLLSGLGIQLDAEKKRTVQNSLDKKK